MNPSQKHNASVFNVQNIRTYQLLFISKDIVIKIKSVKIKCFLRFSIAIIWSNFKRKSPDFYTWFKYVAKNIDDGQKILLSYLAYSQIGLNPPVEHHHFGYITKLIIKIYKNWSKKKNYCSPIWCWGGTALSIFGDLFSEQKVMYIVSERKFASFERSLNFCLKGMEEVFFVLRCIKGFAISWIVYLSRRCTIVGLQIRMR
jgi:hypothetical protein